MWRYSRRRGVFGEQVSIPLQASEKALNTEQKFGPERSAVRQDHDIRDQTRTVDTPCHKWQV